MFNRLGRLGALIQKEIVQLLRDRRTLGIILAIPIIELVLFAYAVDLTVDHLPTAVADMSQDSQSQAVIDALTVSGFFDVKLALEGERDVVRAIDQGRVRAGIVIPPNFASQVERGEAQVLILLDGSDSFTVNSGYSAAAAIIQTHSLDLTQEKARQLGATALTLPINSSARILYNPTMDDMIFILPAMGALLLQVMTINLTALSVVREREMGTLEQLLSTPSRPIELMIGKLLPNALLSGIALLGVIVAGIYWFGVPFRGDPWHFAWAALLFIVSGLGLGLLISTVAKTQKEAQQITMLLLMLSILLTGFIYPRSPMPDLVRAIGSFIPLTYFIRLTRAIYTKGVDISLLWSDVFALAVYGAVVMVVAAGTFKKRLD
ncbi:MAG: ABC transporter permease [Chloroflexota bacterium]|nr:MAG: ABC transporter permease [Chloroflexota bacterium]